MFSVALSKFLLPWQAVDLIVTRRVSEGFETTNADNFISHSRFGFPKNIKSTACLEGGEGGLTALSGLL